MGDVAASPLQGASAESLANRDLARTRRLSMGSQVMHQSQAVRLKGESGKNLSQERSAAVDAQLENEAKIEELQQEFAKVAESYNKWLMQEFEIVEDRFAELDGTAINVTQTSEVYLYDVKCLKPYKGKLDMADKRLREASDKFRDELEDITEKLKNHGVLPEDDNKFTYFDMARLADLNDEFADALDARQEAFDAESERIVTADQTFRQFCEACNNFQDLAELDILEKVRSVDGELEQVVKDVKGIWNNGSDLKAALDKVSELSNECRSVGIVGTNLTLMKLMDDPDAGMLAVDNYVTKYIGQLENELKLKREYNKRANDFSDWVTKTMPKYTPDSLPINLDALDTLTASLHRFRSEEQPKKASDLKVAEDLKRVISDTLQFQGRDGFSPLDNVTLSEQYEKLCVAVDKYEEWLKAEVSRQREIGNWVQEFTAEAVELLEWLKDKQEFLNSSDVTAPKTKSAARSVKALMESYALEYQERMLDLDSLEVLGKKIVEQGYERWEKIAALYDKLCVGFAEASLGTGTPRKPPLPNPPASAR